MPHVVLLRGVNVGGHRRFRPATVPASLPSFDVVNIGAAGTFVVHARATQKEVRAAFAKALPFPVDLAICPGATFTRMLDAAPTVWRTAPADETRFLSVLLEPPGRDAPTSFRLPSAGRWLVHVVARRGRFVFGLYRKDMKTIQALGRVDQLLGAPTTTRTWGTLEKIRAALATRPPKTPAAPKRAKKR